MGTLSDRVDVQECLRRESLASLQMLSRMFGLQSNIETGEQNAGSHISDREMIDVAKKCGLSAKIKDSIAPQDLKDNKFLPALVRLRQQWMILAKIDGAGALLQSPANRHTGQPFMMRLEAFIEQWDGSLLLFKRPKTTERTARFDFSWFKPSIIRHRKYLIDVLLLSLFLQIIAIVTPLLFQVITDKVLVHRSISTLDAIVAGLLIVYLFESFMSLVRTYVFTHATSKIDIELGVKLFAHLIDLPLAYFEARRVGDSVARARELENLRQFLTSNSLTLLLDIVFSIVFIALMTYYSPKLTLVTIACIPLFAATAIIIVPILRKKLECQFQENALSQSLLVEAIAGVTTIKANALGGAFKHRWNIQLAKYVKSSVDASNVGAIAHEIISLISKLATGLILWLGTIEVIEGSISLGMFLAFNMLAQRTIQPIVRIAQMWNDFQQASLSMRRLGDILNTLPEAPEKASFSHRISGNIEFKDVSFSYRPGGTAVVNQLSLTISAGEVIGVVGRSGSGKSTVSKLIQRLYSINEGRLRFDGIDASALNVEYSRRQIGVVLQETLLFNGSIRENLCISDPGCTIEKMIDCAKLAGAHDFIAELPEGYETLVGEHGTGLSGGQKQRIAIARALVNDPSVLIFDEATSALDYESEAIIHKNMANICKGRTVIIIAHRLSAVRHADRILVLDRGQLVEEGSHDLLITQNNGLYRSLWQLQTAT